MCVINKQDISRLIIIDLVVNQGRQKLEVKYWHRKEIDDLKLANVQAVEDAKKEADKLMIEKIKKYEKKIRRLKNDAKDLLNYPWVI